MTNLFIDTNIFLSFYHFSKDDLEELQKLTYLIEQGEIHLLIPKQVVNEFKRNRAIKIEQAIKHIKEQNFNFKFPQITKEYSQYSELRKLQQSFSKLHSELIQAIEKDAQKNELAADSIVNELFNSTEILPINKEIIEKAELRKKLGNPPGKKESLGDAINWETILMKGKVCKDFFIITDDKDYFSIIKPNELNSFLEIEWSEKNHSDIKIYRQISSFFSDHYPQISLNTEVEKNKLIYELSSSNSFSQTHEIISKLSKFDEFTSAQKRLIAYASANNNQIFWIIRDDDVRNFLVKTLEESSYSIETEIIQKLNEHFGEKIFNDIPF